MKSEEMIRVPTLDIEAIKEILPHRYPFLLVDRITDIEPGKRAVGIKNVTANEQFFQGHFPERAIMPGVLLIEVMAQVGGIMILALPEHRGKLAYIASVENAKFRRPIVPGDTLVAVADLQRIIGTMGKVKCSLKVGEETAVEATIMFALVPNRDGKKA